MTVTVPSGYEIESKEGLPQFFDRIPEGSTSFSTEFRLRSRRGNSDRFTVFMVGDPQIRARDRGYDKFAYHSIDMFEDMCRDMNKLCATMTDRPVYGIGLGDIDPRGCKHVGDLSIGGQDALVPDVRRHRQSRP